MCIRDRLKEAKKSGKIQIYICDDKKMDGNIDAFGSTPLYLSLIHIFEFLDVVLVYIPHPLRSDSRYSAVSI